MNFLEHALTYARMGWPVFRLQANSKLPLRGSHGHRDATTDLEVIRRWWAQTPDANIGMACGGGAPVVADADGPGGERDLRALCGGRIPETLAAITARGGWHFFYASAEALRAYNAPRPARGADGLDLKASGGYVVLAPSIVGGKRYGWANWGHAVAAIPPGLLAHARSRGKAREATRQLPAVRPGRLERPAWIAAVAGPDLTGRALTSLAMGELPELLAALRAIPAACSYDDWYAIGAAIHDWDSGARGLAVFRAWSAKGTGGERYQDDVEAGVCERKWGEYEKKVGQERLITKSSIYYRADKILAERARAELSKPSNPKGLRERAESGINTGETAGANQEQVNLQTPPGTIEVDGDSSSQINGHPALPEALTKVDDAIHFPQLGKNGLPTASCPNARVAIRALGLTCSFDEFHRRLLIGGREIGQMAGELSDRTVQVLRTAIYGRFGFDPGPQHAHDAAEQECYLNTFDPLTQYLDGLRWDGKRRLDGWLSGYLGAESSELNVWFGRLVLLAAVRRARLPGAKFDHILVLEGEEGRLKSSAIRVLAGDDNFSDQSILTLSERQQQEALEGVWLYEIAELTGLRRAEVERVKAFMSRQIDRARAAYARHVTRQARRCVFFGTTNEDFYLQAAQGNRRFWMVRCGRIELERLRADRDQLWAEAASVERTAGELVLPESLWGAARSIQEARESPDPWEHIIESIELKDGDKYPAESGGLEYRISTLAIMDIWLQIPTERKNIFVQKRVAGIMRKLGWKGPNKMRINKNNDSLTVRGFSKSI